MPLGSIVRHRQASRDHTTKIKSREWFSVSGGYLCLCLQLPTQSSPCLFLIRRLCWELETERIIHGRLNASWKICSLVVNRQSFLLIDGYLLNFFQTYRIHEGPDNQDIAFNIPVDLYDECFYVTGILSFWILLPSCVLFLQSALCFFC